MMHLTVESQGTRKSLTSEGLMAPIATPLAFEDFYVREYPGVLGLAFVLAGNRSTAEDITQEAFLAAYKEWEKVAGYDQPGAWVRRVTVNISTSAFRRRRSEAKAIARIVARRAPNVPELSADDAEFWAAVRALPRRQSQVVALHCLEDRSVAEISDVLSMAPGTVKKHLHDGRRALARSLELEEDES
jgi:RNA polymerase sigma-70 factor, ECF subfamily